MQDIEYRMRFEPSSRSRLSNSFVTYAATDHRFEERSQTNSIGEKESAMILDLHSASQIVEAALAHARRQSLAPMTVAALDARGAIVALKMEDGSSLLRPEIASGKAWSALAMGFGTRNLAGRAEKLPSFFGALADLAQGRVLPVPGGVLVRDAAGAIVGAVGASGDIADNDEACVITGIEAVGLRADPGTPPSSVSSN
jgi:uncharacterized protein GlcG (DUF336 family)